METFDGIGEVKVRYSAIVLVSCLFSDTWMFRRRNQKGNFFNQSIHLPRQERAHGLNLHPARHPFDTIIVNGCF